ncbi:MAG TPA: ribosome-binding factor A [bacterium]|nr:ribosome-binding factor A [bacterium]
MESNKRANELMREKVAFLVNKLVEFPNGLITIAYVDLSSEGQNAEIGVSVLPTNLRGTALRQLRKFSSTIARTSSKQCRLSRVPRIVWQIDDTEERAAHLDRLIQGLN